MRQQPEEARLTMAGAQALMRTPDDATQRAMRGLPGSGVRARQPGEPRPSGLSSSSPYSSTPPRDRAGRTTRRFGKAA